MINQVFAKSPERVTLPCRAESWVRRCGFWFAGRPTDLGCSIKWSFLAGSCIVALYFVHAESVLAQTSGPVVVPAPTIAPAPLGSPFVPVGPVADPNGQPPMAIGPAPAPNGFAFGYPYGPWLAPPPVMMAPPGYTVFQPPPNPYAVRRPTPFEAQAAPANFPPRAFDSRFQSGQPGLFQPGLSPAANQISVAKMPAPIGNLRITVSERFLNRLIARDEQRPGDVRDFILGAQVTGRQMTATQLRVDLVPGADKIHGYLVLNGTTNSQTTGVTPQATVDVNSQQQFFATKELVFDGMSFSTRHAVVHVQARNQTVGAVTPLSGTMFGGIADRIAYRAAQRRQPEAEAIARDRVAERVFPEFDSEIDKRLAQANEQLEGTVRRGLRLMNFMPSLQQVSSTDTSFNYSAQIGSDAPTASIPSLQNQLVRDESVSLLVHESLLNALIPVAGLKGLKTTDKQIKSYLAPFEFKPNGDELENSKPPIAIPGLTNLTTDIEFDENDPLTIQFEKDRTLVTLRAKFKPAGQLLVPPLAVKIEYTTELVGNKLVVTPGKARVSLQKSEDGDSISSVTLTILSQAIESSLSKLAFDRSLPASLWPFGGSVPGIVAVRIEDGWSAVSIE